jgi:hypothetical protein
MKKIQQQYSGMPADTEEKMELKEKLDEYKKD